MAQKITDWELCDMGIEHSQYFQGFGFMGTGYANCCYGIGSDPAEALDDCLEQVAQTMDCDVEGLERDILAQFPDFQNAEIIEEHSVESYLRQENPEEWFDDEGEFQGEDCELYYHVGLRWNTADE